MPRSMHMIKYYKDYNDQLEIDIKNTRDKKTKGPLAFFLFYCYVLFWGYVFWMPPLPITN